jgi:iron complex outermembrane receptor protein
MFKESRLNRRLISILMANLTAGTTAAQAQTLEEVVVTAQKCEQSLQDVPLAVSALTSEAMRDAGVQHKRQ